MTRSLGLFIQILLHALPACAAGYALFSMFGTDDAAGWRRSLGTPFVVGCALAASSVWVSLLHRKILEGEYSAAGKCAFLVPLTASVAWLSFAGGIAWTVIAQMSFLVTAVTVLLSLPIQGLVAPNIARLSMRQVPFEARHRDWFRTPLLAFAQTCVAVVIVSGTCRLDPTLGGLELITAFTALLWLTSFRSWFSRSHRASLAASGLCGLAVPVCALVAYVGWQSPGHLAGSVTEVARIGSVSAFFTVPLFVVLGARLLPPAEAV